MFDKILIANRGEIALRVIRACREMGIQSVAVHSTADSDAMHVRMADEAICIGPPPGTDSYLSVPAIVAACEITGAQAIHPGYGFLSENANFVQVLEDHGITFIGPTAEHIRVMGDKITAKDTMIKLGVPCVPGSDGGVPDVEAAKRIGAEIGYPVIIKATAGGGGRGMKVAETEADIESAFHTARAESKSAFGNDEVYIEKYLQTPRHIEIQVFGDGKGKAVHLGERDCSLQRRHQKVFEEAPGPAIDAETRARIGKVCADAVANINYIGAGTIEFLYENGEFYFIEMNTRLQVEHPVTEMITGQDLVEWQLRVANNETLPMAQDALGIHGHAFEARIYAEDPNNDFLPATGRLSLLQPPGESHHVRVDTGVVQGDEVSVFYDPMIAKLIVWDENREKALARLTKALTEYHIDGVVTNIEFLYNLANSEPFRTEQIDTGFIEKNQDVLQLNSEPEVQTLLPMAALYLMLSSQQTNTASHQDQYSPWSLGNAWRANEQHIQTLELQVGDTVHQVQVVQTGTGSQAVYNITVGQQEYHCSGVIVQNQLLSTINGHKTLANVTSRQDGYSVFCNGNVIRFNALKADLGDDEDNDADAGFVAPMNGTVVAILVEPQQSVEKGQTLMVMEAMKMEHSLKAPANGVVTEFYFKAGELVDGGAELLAFQPSQESA
mgnify:CR=1 FL=1